MDNVFTGIGTQLRRLVGTDWVLIAGVTNINGPGSARDTVDTTTLDNDDGYREFITGLRDGGTLTFDLTYSKAQYQDLLDAFESDDTERYMVYFARQQAGAVIFDGLITDLPLTIPLDDKVSVSATIKVTGAVDLPDDGPYLITYDANGADEGAAPASQVKEHGTSVALRANTGALGLAAHVFVGWNTKADGSGTPYNVGATFALDAYTTLYAEWDNA
jgi:predicted secreted protein